MKEKRQQKYWELRILKFSVGQDVFLGEMYVITKYKEINFLIEQRDAFRIRKCPKLKPDLKLRLGSVKIQGRICYPYGQNPYVERVVYLVLKHFIRWWFSSLEAVPRDGSSWRTPLWLQRRTGSF